MSVSSCRASSLGLVSNMSCTSVSSSVMAPLSSTAAETFVVLPLVGPGKAMGGEERKVGEMGLVARERVGFSLGIGPGEKLRRVGEEAGDESESMGGGAYGRLACRRSRVPKFLR